MRLLQDLERHVATEESLFRAQLLREDVARLRRLQELARTAPDREAFMTSAVRLGWTQGDLRTGELGEPLQALLQAVYGFERGKRDAEQEARIVDCWNALHRVRMERLLGCLSTPAPRPAD
jgi:hypothetical protein